MDAEYSDDQEALRAAVRRFLEHRADRATVRAWCGPGPPSEVADLLADPLPSPVWRGLVDLGVVGLLAPPAFGGGGGGLTDLGPVLEEHGRALLPGPLLPTAVGAVLALRPAAESGDAHATRWLEEVVGGEVRAAVVRAPDLTTTTAGPALRLEGATAPAVGAGGADLLIVLGRAGPGEISVIDRRNPDTDATVSRQPVDLVDPTARAARLHLDGTPAHRLEPAEPELVVDALALAHVLDGVGAAEAALALAVTYAGERHQFGVPIGSFQAVQHLAADMLRRVELTRAAAYHALWAVDAAATGGPDRHDAHRAVTLARAAAVEHLPDVGAAGIQVHGGIGFTWEHDAHLFHERLLTMAALVGTPHHPLDELPLLPA